MRRILRGPVAWIALAVLLVIVASSLLTNARGPREVPSR
jgi:hypothetical protein